MNVRSTVVTLVVLALSLAGALGAENTPLSPNAAPLPSPLVDAPASAQELSGLPEVLWMTNCQLTYNYCIADCALYEDPQACELGCQCNYYVCKGIELPNECLW
jgi:hypothetical protein